MTLQTEQQLQQTKADKRTMKHIGIVVLTLIGIAAALIVAVTLIA